MPPRAKTSCCTSRWRRMPHRTAFRCSRPTISRGATAGCASPGEPMCAICPAGMTSMHRSGSSSMRGMSRRLPARRNSPRPSPDDTSAEVDLGLEIGARVGVGERFLETDPSLLVELVERGVEALDALFAGSVDGFLDRHHITLLDQGGDVRG